MLPNVLSIVSYSILPYSTGGQKLIAQFNEYLATSCNLTVVSTQENEARLANGYRLLPWMRNGYKKFFDFPLVIKLIKYIRSSEIQHVIIEHPYMGWMGWLLQKICKIELIVHTHNIEFERFKSIGKRWWPILKYYEIWVLKQADLVFCISLEDKSYMVNRLGINSKKCFEIPFGVPISYLPTDKLACKRKITTTHGINFSDKILLFNGALGYLPNLMALKIILNIINPALLQHKQLKYKIIICGKGLPAELKNLKSYEDENIVYAGFVNDVETYFKGADIFLNTVTLGGGVKTKLIEALAFNTTVISTVSGAAGCDSSICGDKLIQINDGNWSQFTQAVIQHLSIHASTPNTFYQKYFWGNIVHNVINKLKL